MLLHRQVEEYGDEVFDKLDKGAHIYFCGLKGMMPGILSMLESVAKKKKLDWEEFIKELKEKGKQRFHRFYVCQSRSFPFGGCNNELHENYLVFHSGGVFPSKPIAIMLAFL